MAASAFLSSSNASQFQKRLQKTSTISLNHLYSYMAYFALGKEDLPGKKAKGTEQSESQRSDLKLRRVPIFIEARLSARSMGSVVFLKPRNNGFDGCYILGWYPVHPIV